MARATCRHESCITFMSAGYVRYLLEEQHGQGYLQAAKAPQVPVHVSTCRQEILPHEASSGQQLSGTGQGKDSKQGAAGSLRSDQRLPDAPPLLRCQTPQSTGGNVREAMRINLISASKQGSHARFWLCNLCKSRNPKD